MAIKMTPKQRREQEVGDEYKPNAINDAIPRNQKQESEALEGHGCGNNDGEMLSREEVAAFVDLRLSIAGRAGRHSFTTTCPFCKTLITTETISTENPDVVIAKKCRFRILNIFFLIIAIGVTVFAYKFLQNIPAPTHEEYALCLILVGLLGVLPLLCVGFYYWYIRNMFQDIQHFCPHCKKCLGNSNGMSAWDRQGRRDQNNQPLVTAVDV